jgi:putative oxidoreductase
MKSLLYPLFSSIQLKSWIAALLIAIPRFVGGILLSFEFGSGKFGMPWTDKAKNLDLFQVSPWFPEDVAKFGFPFSLSPLFFAWMAAATEAIGGLLYAVGIGTRIFAFLIMCTMLVAIFYQKWGEGTWSMLPAMSFLWISMYTIVTGSGRLGIDRLIARKLSK